MRPIKPPPLCNGDGQDEKRFFDYGVMCHHSDAIKSIISDLSSLIYNKSQNNVH